jgi:hypothetical protein
MHDTAVECAVISRLDYEMKPGNHTTKIDMKMPDRGAATGIRACVTGGWESLPGILTTFSTETP